MDPFFKNALTEFDALTEGGKNEQMVAKKKGFLQAGGNWNQVQKTCPRKVYLEWGGDAAGMLPGGEGLPPTKLLELPVNF